MSLLPVVFGACGAFLTADQLLKSREGKPEAPVSWMHHVLDLSFVCVGGSFLACVGEAVQAAALAVFASMQKMNDATFKHVLPVAVFGGSVIIFSMIGVIAVICEKAGIYSLNRR